MIETNRLYAAEGQQLMQERDVSQSYNVPTICVCVIHQIHKALDMNVFVCPGARVPASRGSSVGRRE